MSPRLLRPRAAGGFNPQAIAGLAIWLDASDQSTVTLNSATVSEWRDKSGNGRHASQSTAANQPVYDSVRLNGLRTITFDNVNKRMSGAAPSSTEYSFFCVFKYQSTSGAYARPFTLARATTSDTTAPAFIVLSRNNGTTTMQSPLNSGAGFVNGGGIAYAYDAWAVASVNYNSSLLSNRRNNGEAVTLSSPPSMASANFTRFGIADEFTGSGTFSSLIGYYAEALLFSRSLSTEEETAIARYLGNKWGVKVS